MNFRIHFFAVFLILALSTNTLPAADIQDEILGIKWGSTVAELKNFSKLWQKDTAGFYINPGINHTIYEFQVPNVVYGFYLDKFFAVYAKIDDPAIFEKLKNHLTSDYGAPKISQTLKNEQKIFTWKDRKIKIKLKHYQKDGKMKLAFYYIPLSSMLNETQQEKLQEKTWTLFPMEKGRAPENLKQEDLPSIPILRF